MKISIITATYNSSKTLRDTLESVLNQTYQDIEHIIVDGASKDSTLEIIKEYEQKFNGRLKWISEKDNGIYDAMNKGITLSSGDIVGILNSDDFFTDNNVVTDIIDCFEKKSIDSLFANLNFVKQDDISKIVRVWKGSPYKENGFRKGWHPSHPTFYVKKEIYKKYGVFDLNFDVSADFELMLRFIEKYKISTYYLDRVTVKMRYGGESTGSISKIIIGNKNILKAFKKNGIKVSVFYPIIRLVPKVLEFIKKK